MGATGQGSVADDVESEPVETSKQILPDESSIAENDSHPIPFLAFAATAAWTVVIAVYYFVSRRFTEAYYGELGIPSSELEFDFADYLFAAGNTHPFIALLAIVLLIAIALPGIINAPRNAGGQPGLGIKVVLGLFVILEGLLAYAGFGIASVPNFVPESDWIFFTVSALALTLGVLLTFNRWVQSSIRHNERYLLVAVLLSGLWLATFQVGGLEVWGEVAAQSDSGRSGADRKFHEMTVTASQPIGPESDQAPQDESGNWHSGPYLMLLKSGGLTWFKGTAVDDDVFAVRTDLILELSPQRFE